MVGIGRASLDFGLRIEKGFRDQVLEDSEELLSVRYPWSVASGDARFLEQQLTTDD
jgi:hypothetical protein